MERPAPVDDVRPTTSAGPSVSMGRGEVVNLMADLRRRLQADEEMPKLTDVQNRLVMQRLEEAGTWEEPRGSRAEQIQRIAKTVASVSALDVEETAKELEACC